LSIFADERTLTNGNNDTKRIDLLNN